MQARVRNAGVEEAYTGSYRGRKSGEESNLLLEEGNEMTNTLLTCCRGRSH